MRRIPGRQYTLNASDPGMHALLLRQFLLVQHECFANFASLWSALLLVSITMSCMLCFEKFDTCSLHFFWCSMCALSTLQPVVRIAYDESTRSWMLCYESF